MRIITFNPKLKNSIDKSIRKGAKISIKFGNEKKTYQNYDQRINRLFTDLSTDILRDAECCVADFPENQVFFTCISEDGTYPINNCSGPA
jgi:hypothetical protein